MYHLKILFLFLFSLICLSLQAQKYNFSDKPEEFIVAVNDMLQKTQRENVINTSNAFSKLWNEGNLNASQKTKIIELTKKLNAKKATPAGEFASFYNCMNSASMIQKLNGSQMTEFLEVADKVVEKRALKEIRNFFDRSHLFFSYNSLFGNRYHRYYALKGNFKFEFLEKPDEKLQNELSATSDDSIKTQVREITGPIIRFTGIDFYLATSFDSAAVKNTNGVFLVLPNVFMGKGGKFDWKILDFDPSKVYCDLDAWSVDVGKPTIKAPNSTMTYSLLLKRSVKGTFEYASNRGRDVKVATYPKFVSSVNDVEIPELSKGLSYKGGFTLEGRKIICQAGGKSLSSISGIGSDGTKAFEVKGNRFVITDSLITSSNVRFNFYFNDTDSLFHANLQFKYFKPKNEIQLVRDRNTEASITPFINNHHEMYMEADLVRYNIEKDSLDIFMVTGVESQRPAVFESFDFFNRERFYKMAGTFDFHPLRLLNDYASKTQKQSFTVQDFAMDMKRNEGIMRNLALELRTRGYIDYNDETGLISLGKKLNQNINSDLFVNSVARVDAKTAKKADFDVYYNNDHDNFRIESYVKGKPNASLTKKNNELVIRGISRFPVSEALGVYIIPDSSKQSVTVYKDRSIYLEKGEIDVGNFRFFGQQFFLLYDDFSLEMPIIDKILFAVTDSSTKEKHFYGGEIRFGAGNMKINDPMNKSGLKKGKIKDSDDAYETYPKLNIPAGGVVYFYNEFRQNFAYDSTKAKFVLDEIDLDSLNSKVPIFKGKFVSSMFSEFEEKLIPMPFPDMTMGFVHKPPKAGYQLYPDNEVVKNAKVKFSRDLVMNRDGLSSGGEINYLTTLLKSQEFIFMPDSVTADNIEFNVGAATINGAEFAEASGKTAQLRWLVNDDRMLLTNKEEIIKLENSRTTLSEGVFEQRYKEKLLTLYGSTNPITLRGDLIVTATGLKGEGNLVRKDFTVLSVSEEPMRFGINRFSGSNVEFKINSKDRDPYEFDRGFFYTNNKAVLLGNFVDFDFDLAGGKAVVRPDAEFSDFASLNLPYAEYKTSIKEAVWELKKKNITMTGDSTSRFTSTVFGSEDTNIENLTFNASNALYDIPNLTLTVSGIPFINSADASIVPKEGKAVILKDAEMQQLKEAKVLIDTLYRYHRLFNGNIKINSRLDFEGDATYQFVNVQKDTFNVKFDKFELIEEVTSKEKKDKRKGRPLKITYAKGEVKESDKFYISSRVQYKGLIEMYANRRNLSLDGFIKLDLTSRTDYNNWIPYKSDKGDSVVLNIPEKLSIENDVVTSGVHFTSGTYDMYSTFLSTKQSPNDSDIMLASGKLEYNPAINEFKISPEDKTKGLSYAGNRLIFDDSKGSIYIEGLMNLLDANASKMLKISGTGVINKKDSISSKFDTFQSFNLPISFKSILPIQNAIRAKIPEKSYRLDKNDPMVYKIADMVGDKAIKKYFEDIKVKPTPINEISEEMNRPFVFSKVEMNWSDEYKTFHSVGPLHLLSIANKVYDADITGFVEIYKNNAGDNFTLYLQPDPDLWYYFELDQGVFRILSSDETFNTSIESKSVELASIDKKEAFISKFRELYGAPELPQGTEEEENPDNKEEGKDEIKEESKVETKEEGKEESKEEVKEEDKKVAEDKKDSNKDDKKKDKKVAEDKKDSSKDDKKKENKKKDSKKTKEDEEGF